ncbi:hypothetical protein Enr13x_65560 [Stieleria neptunia]|uniref:Flagellar biosynthesis protein, FliO n=1 Tax=Stieleria neptunia TaxID=2527979 RepID=A0A518I0T4_9BACT|nr:flagellar biosynthetic protein FliO [Stieleria neptunia]QDV46647.1 hypothetical protein Enr13x_65560 [Stieleria neptunia]
MVNPLFRILVCFAAFALSHGAAIGQAQERPRGPSVYRSPEATVSDRSTSVGQVHDASVVHELADEFPDLMVSDAAADDGQTAEGTLAGPVVTTVSSLLVVLAVFGGLVWISRRYGSSRTLGGALPDDVLRNLGSAAIDAKTRVTFLKVGARILVIGQTPTGDPHTLSEITEPDEVARLTNRCLGRPEIVGRRTGYPSGVDRGSRDLGSRESSRRDLAAG